MNYSELLQLAKGWGNFKFYRGIIWRLPNNSYSFKDIGKYFSALGNEANIRGKNEAWLILGITNKGELKGTDYRKSGNPQSLKKFLNLLQKMKTEGIVGVCGRAVHAEWFLVKIM